MSFCHGKGNTETDGCCYVAGAPCPLRLKIVDGRVYAGPDLTDLGTITEYVATLSTNRQVRQRAADQAQGLNIACRAAIEVIVQDASRLSDRAAFEAAWNTHPDYVALVRPHWEVIEENLGLTPGSYQCSSWTGSPGTARAECCFAEPEAENSARRAVLSSAAVTIRSKRSV